MLPQSLPSQRPLLFISIFQGLPRTVGGLVLTEWDSGLLKVTDTFAGTGWLRAHKGENFMVLPLRALLVCVQSVFARQFHCAPPFLRQADQSP